MCYISSVFLYFHWHFNNRHYFYDKGTFIGFFESSPFARLYLEVLVTMPRLNLKTVCVDSLSFYISFLYFLALFSSRKQWLHGKLINWTSAFYLSFVCVALPRILNILIFINTIFHVFSYVILHRMVLVSILTTSRYII